MRWGEFCQPSFNAIREAAEQNDTSEKAVPPIRRQERSYSRRKNPRRTRRGSCLVERRRHSVVRVTQVRVPDVDLSKIRRRMGLSQTQFAFKFGFPPATLPNWEQRRVRPDTSTRLLLAVIAKHPESVEDVLKDGRLIGRHYDRYYGDPVQLSVATRCSATGPMCR